MSRNTVDRLLRLREPPRYTRPRKTSQLDPFTERIAGLLAEDPTARATVIRERLQADGYRGGITILKDHLAKVRPAFRASRAYQRTSYQPGEIGQVDWWHTGAQIPVGRGRTREAFGLVVTLPSRPPFGDVHVLDDRRRLCPALVGCLERLGGVPQKLVFDNDTSIVVPESGRPRRAKPSGRSAMPRRASSRCVASTRSTTSRTSTIRGRPKSPIGDTSVGSGARVGDRHAVERGLLADLPDPKPDTDLRLEARAGKDAFVRVLGVDYSVPPAFVGRGLGVRVGPTTVRISCEGTEVAVHVRSFAPADVVLDPAHGRAIRLAREARDRLASGDPDVPSIDLGRYDALFEVPA